MQLSLKKKIAQHNAALYAVAYWHKAGLILTGGADKVVASWDINTFENTNFSIKTNSAILSLQLIENEKYLLIGLFNGNLHIIDLALKQEVKFIPFHKTGLFAMAYHASNQRLILGSGDGTYSIWDTNDFSLLDKGKLAFGKIRSLQLLVDDVYLGTSEGNLVRINLNDFSIHKCYTLVDNGIFSLWYHPIKKLWLLATKNAHIYAIDVEQQKEIFNFPAHNWPVYKIEQLNDEVIATCSRDKTIKIWNTHSLDLIQRLEFNPHKSHTHSINNLLYIPQHKYLLSVSDDKSLAIWDCQV